MSGSVRLRLGTRASALARWQADWVAAWLTGSGVEVELVPITTRGDQQQQGPLGSLGGQGLFTKELQRALLDDRIDLAVHSLKDLPTDEVPGLCLAAVPQRGPVGDVLVAREAADFQGLREGAVVGTGSLRRRAQLLHAREKLDVRDIRGNVDTRLRKLADGEYDAIVLAEAGLVRLGLDSQITQRLPASLMLPAVGQGALGVESRMDDESTRSALAALDDPATHAAITAERALLASLRGGCLAPIGAWAQLLDGARLSLAAAVLSADGQQRLLAEDEVELAGSQLSGTSGELATAVNLGHRVAENLLDRGAADLIATVRRST